MYPYMLHAYLFSILSCPGALGTRMPSATLRVLTAGLEALRPDKPGARVHRKPCHVFRLEL